MAIITSELFFAFFACVCAFLLGLYVYVTRNFKYWKKMGVKQLEPSFPFGNFGKCIFMKQSIHEFIEQIYHKSEGENMIGFYVFDKPYVLLRDPELLRTVFIKDFNSFTNKLLCDNKSDPFGSHTLFLLSNPPWKQIRQKMTPMFTSGKLKKNFDLMMEICKDLDFYFNSLNVNDKTGKPVEIREACAKFMTDIIGITAFNIRFDSLKDPEAPFRKFGKAIVRSQWIRYMQVLSILFVPPLRSILNARFFDIGTEFFQNTFDRIMEERIKAGDKKNDFVDLIIDAIKNEDIDNSDVYKVDRYILKVQLPGIFTAGFETSSTTTSFALYLLATHLEVQKRMRDELSDAMRKTNGKLTYDIVTNASYLNMVTRETLRMYPILTWIDRLADVDYTFPGTNITIKKGTPVIYPVHSMHMNPQYFPDPKKFDPERFSDENKSKIIPFTYAPFGEGPRNCIGSRLGLLQVNLALAYMVTNYEITPCETTPIPLKNDRMNVLMHPSGDINLNLKKIAL